MRQNQGGSLTTGVGLNEMATRRIGDTLANTSERRIDVLNSHETRISVLESNYRDSLHERQQHSKAIDELNKSLHDTVMTLREGLAVFNGKFDSLFAQIKIAFYILSVGCTVVIFLIGSFIAYNKQLDDKYLNHSQQVSQDISELQNKKVIKASK